MRRWLWLVLLCLLATGCGGRGCGREEAAEPEGRPQSLAARPEKRATPTPSPGADQPEAEAVARAPISLATPLLTVHHQRGRVAWAVERLFVARPAQRHARVYAVEPQRVTELVTVDALEGVPVEAPVGVAIDPYRGRFYLTDALRNRLAALTVVETGDGAWRAEVEWVAGAGDGAEALDHPGGVDVDADGNVYVADMGHARVAVFSPEGAFLRAIGGFAAGPGRLRSLIDVAVDPASGVLYAVDALDRRIEVFALGGAHARTIGANAFKERLVLPAAAEVCSGGDLLVADFGGHRIHVLPAGRGPAESWGEFGRTDGRLLGPSGIACDERGTIAVLDSGANRVQLFAPGGRWLRTITLARIELPPRRVRDPSLGEPVVSPGATPGGRKFRRRRVE